MSMIFLSTGDLLALEAELASSAYAGLSDDDRWRLLHAGEGTIPNPQPQPSISAPVTLAALLPILSGVSQIKVASFVNFNFVLREIETGSRNGISIWVRVLEGLTLVTPAEAAALAAYLTTPILDPSWSTTIPGPTPKSRLFGQKTWREPDGGSVDFIPLAAVEAART